jgi:DNA-binding NtrC family response regulator
MIEMVKAGQFREDLYYRLNVFPIMVPPLRQRREDVGGLVEHFIIRFAAEEGRKIRAIDGEALAMLEAYAWPGNVRQLENAVFRAVVLCESDRLSVDDFPQIAALVEGYEVRIPPAPLPTPKPALPCGQAAIIGADGVPSGPIALGAVSDGIALGIPAVTEGGHIRRLEEVEADMIRLALHRYRGQMSEVARKLGIGRSTLYRKMRDLGLEAKM